MTSFYSLLDEYRVHLAGTTPRNELGVGIDKVGMAAAANGGPNALLSLPDNQITFGKNQTPYQNGVKRAGLRFRAWVSEVHPGLVVEEEKRVWPTANRFREFAARGRWDTEGKREGRICPACGPKMILGYKMGAATKIWTCPKCNLEIQEVQA